MRVYSRKARIMCIRAAESKVSSHLPGILQPWSRGPPPTLAVQLCLWIYASFCHLLARVVLIVQIVGFTLRVQFMVYLLIPLLGQLGCCAEPFIVMYGCICMFAHSITG